MVFLKDKMYLYICIYIYIHAILQICHCCITLRPWQDEPPAIVRAASKFSSDDLETPRTKTSSGRSELKRRPSASGSFSVSSSGNDTTCNKRLKTPKNGDAMGSLDDHFRSTLEQPDCPFQCIVINDQEWQSVLQGSRVLLRPYQSQKGSLALALKMGHNFCVMATTSLARCVDLKGKGTQECLEMAKGFYGAKHINAMKTRVKTLWGWEFHDFHPFAVPVKLHWLDNNFRNRPFKLTSNMIAGDKVDTTGPGPSDLCLKQTAEFFFRRGGLTFQKGLIDQLEKLRGRAVRIGTTCSGCDICITTLRKIVERFNSDKDRGVVFLLTLRFPTSREKHMLVCIYLYTCEFCICPRQGQKPVEIVHVFSVELNDDKRRLLMKQHTDVKHVFSDVNVFEHGKGFCHVCRQDCTISRDTMGIDMLIAGPSCKDLSKLNRARTNFAGAYEEEDPSGTSGPTYRSGFKRVPWRDILTCVLVWDIWGHRADFL